MADSFLFLVGTLPMPSPPTSPLPPGVEILRPNQDVFVRSWQPRPVFLQINEPLDPDHPESPSSAISAPAVVVVSDPATGCPLERPRPRFEVGLTDPVLSGPWQSLRIRFRAARSRPPQVEPDRPTPPDGPEAVAPRQSPPPFVSVPIRSEQVGNWQVPPFEARLVTGVGSPPVPLAISAPVLDPPGAPARVEMDDPPDWEEGWNRITLRVHARARAARVVTIPRVITGLAVIILDWTDTTEDLTAISPPVPPYRVRWDPLVGASSPHVTSVADLTIRGNGILATDTTLEGTFALVASDDDFLRVEVSLDDVSYGGAVPFSLIAFQSIVVYYRITISSGGTTPAGPRPIGAVLAISGPDFATPVEVLAWPDHPAPFTIAVAADVDRVVPLETVCRIRVNPRGNALFDAQPALHVGPLTADWILSTLVWSGFWDRHRIDDLHFDLQALPDALGGDSPFVDIDRFEAEIRPYCPGLDPPPTLVLPPPPVRFVPDGDLAVVGWAPTPAFAHLLSDATRVASDFTSVDPRLVNQLRVSFSGIPDLPGPAAGFSRAWIRLTAVIQARLVSTGSTQAVLRVSTDFGAEQDTDPLGPEVAIYRLIWEDPDGLTSDQVDRLEGAIAAIALVSGDDEARVEVMAFDLEGEYRDVPTGVSPPPPPLRASYVTVLDPQGEAFSCGSLGGCAGSPVGRLIGRVVVDNMEGVGRDVMFVAEGPIRIRVFDTITPTTEYSLTTTVPAATQVNFSIFGWVGTVADPYPLDPLTGRILISLTHGIAIEDQFIHWKYIGF